MSKEIAIKSDALEANLKETRTDKIIIPPDHLGFIKLSVDYYSIHTRAIECMNEYNHPFSNSSFVIGQLRSISLGDFWFYDKPEHSGTAWATIISLFQGVLARPLNETTGEEAIHSLLELIEKLLESPDNRQKFISHSLKVIDAAIGKHSAAVTRNSTYLLRVFSRAEWPGNSDEEAIELARKVLIATATYWRDTTKVDQWLDQKRNLFSESSREKFKSIGKDWYNSMISDANQAKDWEDLLKIPGFNDISLHIRQLHHGFDRFHEKFYFLLYLLHLDGMQNQKELLLRDFNNLLRNIKNELSSDEVFGFLDNIFKLFNDLKVSNPGTVLDCILTLGKEIFRTDNQLHIAHFEKLLIRHGFIAPGIMYVSKDWQLEVNEYHIKNIRVWMELIEYSPHTFRDLLSALIIHLRLGGVFVSDTDLFQRDVTALLNSDIKPIFKQIKQLARLFPVYFNEIGAEGELREVTTAMDELSHRNDRLIHFLRKQVHTESNNTHIELTTNIIRYWYDGNAAPLEKKLPEDVKLFLAPDSMWFTGINELLKSLCETNNCMPDALMSLTSDKIKKQLDILSSENTLDKQRLFYIFRLIELLREKYSFNTVNLGFLLHKFNFFNQTEIEGLLNVIDRNLPDRSLRQVFHFMRKLNTIIMSLEKTEGWEDIYHKRHIAIGIPSMYGKYREPKFEALGLENSTYQTCKESFGIRKKAL